MKKSIFFICLLFISLSVTAKDFKYQYIEIGTDEADLPSESFGFMPGKFHSTGSYAEISIGISSNYFAGIVIAKNEIDLFRIPGDPRITAEGRNLILGLGYHKNIQMDTDMVLLAAYIESELEAPAATITSGNDTCLGIAAILSFLFNLVTCPTCYFRFSTLPYN